jgi:hypothetical protein
MVFVLSLQVRVPILVSVIPSGTCFIMFLTMRSVLQIRAKFGTENSHLVLISAYVIRENWSSESHTYLRSCIELFPPVGYEEHYVSQISTVLLSICKSDESLRKKTVSFLW